MPEQQNNADAEYAERQRRRRQAAADARTQTQTQTQTPAQAELQQLLAERRQEVGRAVVEMFRTGFSGILIRLGEGRFLRIGRSNSSTQMSIVNLDDEVFTVVYFASAELLDANEDPVARVRLEVTARRSLDDEDDDQSYVANSSTSGGDDSDSNSSAAPRQEDDADIGDSDANSDSDQELYREEIQGRRISIDLSYEGTLAFLRELGGTGPSGYEPPNHPPSHEARMLRQLSRTLHEQADEEEHPLPALYDDNSGVTPEPTSSPTPEQIRTVLRAISDHWTDVVQNGNPAIPIICDDFADIEEGAFNTMINIVFRYRMDPDEVNQNGASELESRALRGVGLEWTDIVEFLRREGSDEVVDS
ncbi:hypothetical protein PRZ48_005444 [Zasmidium cellare]|uniref:Uncharacterized protein n=1 Tax=Zasmidium cellare TaxID=395010 RepID=A0ABR0ETN1_ZASCE|nr:hypothetical protein PRZ48_005444 [Zasmidium cellare]